MAPIEELPLTFKELGKLAIAHGDLENRYEIEIDEDWVRLKRIFALLLLRDPPSGRVPVNRKKLGKMLKPRFRAALWQVDADIADEARRAHEQKEEQHVAERNRFDVRFGRVCWNASESFVIVATNNVVSTLLYTIRDILNLEGRPPDSLLDGYGSSKRPGALELAERFEHNEEFSREELAKEIMGYKYMFNVGMTPVDTYASCRSHGL